MKSGESQVELMRINFKFEAPILQVQIITGLHYLFYNLIMEMLTYFRSMPLKAR